MLPVVVPDTDCARLLVSRGQISSLVSSPTFPLLLAALSEHDDLAHAAVHQLHEAGHQVQAASVEVRREIVCTQFDII